MAFVYRSERQASYIQQNNQLLGPGMYDVANTTEKKDGRNTYVSQLGRQVNKPYITPGPGFYNVQDSMDGQKVIFQSAENEIKILEIPKPLSIFHSSTVRQEIIPNKNNPGPGSYDPELKVQKIAFQTKQLPKRNIVEELMKASKYQSIPSIPSKLQSYGYTENENNELNLNHNPQIKYTGNPNDMVGPGTYNAKDNKHLRPRALSWKGSQVPEKSKIDTSFSSVGPGTYDIGSQIPFYKHKASAAFTSKSVRTNDTRKGMVFMAFMKDRMKKQEISYNDKNEDDDDSEGDYEFVDDTTPGPGYYPNASTASTIASQVKSESNGCHFGAKSIRFKEHGVPKTITVGPGHYNLIQPQNKIQTSNTPFLTSEPRFDSKIKGLIPGPTYYDPKQSMEEKLIQTLQKAPLGSFGVNEDRFKDNHLRRNAQIGPGLYNIQKQPTYNKQKYTSSFKNNGQRSSLVNRESAPPPGAYDQMANTIQENCRKDEEDDPELAIDRPGFGVGAPRWNQNKVPEVDEDEQPIQRSMNDLFKKKPQNLPPFNSRTKRFNYSVDQKPGPGEYQDGSQMPWNKRTFNIIFAEI